MDVADFKEKTKVKLIQLELRPEGRSTKLELVVRSINHLHREILQEYLEKNNLEYEKHRLKSGIIGPFSCGPEYSVEGMGDGFYEPASQSLEINYDSDSYDYGCGINFRHLKQYQKENQISISVLKK